jgi:UDP-N-acetylmuramoyl-L-alanyl-D-glutamate--2,6-diaminopimelate ligase
MGKIAERFSDIAIITDDNPRHEDPQLIRSMIMRGCSSGNSIEIGDRKLAIDYAIRILSDGDVLLIAGKGHETYQLIGDKTLNFNDRIVVRDILNVLNNDQEME